MQKTKRVVNKKYLKEMSLRSCLLCGGGPCSPHHMTTKGSGGGDSHNNIIPLCIKHHREIHDIGIFTMIDKYNILLNWLIMNNRDDIIAKYKWQKF